MALFNEQKIQKQLKWLVEQIRCMQSSACACDFQEPELTFNSETGELSVTFVDGTVSTVTLDVSSQELITEPIPVILGATEGLGKYKHGDIITPPVEGWTFAQLITDIAQRLLVPDLNPPFLTASLSVTGTREVGENYTANLIANFNRGQIVGKTVDGIWEETEPQDFIAGTATSYELNDGEPQLLNSISVTRTLVLGTNTFNAKVNFAEGPQPIDSAGNNFSTPLPSGSLIASTNRIARRRQFFGPTSITPTNSTEVRALPITNFDTSNSVTLVTGTTETKFAIAIPVDKYIQNVTDTTNLFANLTSAYLDGLISDNFTVNDIGGNPQVYKLYVLEVGAPYAVPANHVITLTTTP